MVGTSGFPDYFLEKAVTTPLCYTALVALGIAPPVSLGSSAWPSGGLAILVPITINEVVTLQGFVYVVGGTPGNFDLGLYSTDFKRVVSTGSFTPVANQGHISSCTPSTIGPGRYYLAAASDSNTGVLLQMVSAMASNTFFGCVEAPGSFPLPGTISPSYNDARFFIPIIGFHLA